MKYEKLTNYINIFSNNYSAGNWVVGERPVRAPFLRYDSHVSNFVRDMGKFMDQDYDKTLITRGVDVGNLSIQNIDVSTADDKEVLALITYVINSERFCDGEIKDTVESGVMTKWLIRLRDVDVGEVF